MAQTLMEAIAKAEATQKELAALNLGTTPTVVPIPPEVTKTIDEALKPQDTWTHYTVEELYWWNHLLLKRATILKPNDKDIEAAENYLGMYKAALRNYDPGCDPETHPNVIGLTTTLNALKGS